MYGLLIILHVLLSLTLIGVVLVQTGKGADIGAAFGGGSSQTVFGGRGPTTFLHRLTTALAALFMVTSIVLTIYGSRRGPASVIPDEPVKSAPSESAPAAPANPAPAQSEKPASPR